MVRVSLVVGLLAMLLVPRLDATVIVPVTMAELAQEARIIARGRVIGTASQSTGDWRSIETVVTLATENTLKGSVGATFEFRVPGGQVGRYRRLVVGAPTFQLDQRVIVFLNDRGTDVPYVIGMGQGVFRLALESGEWVVTAPVPTLTGVLPLPILRGDPSRRPIPLADFERDVRLLVGGAR